MSTIAIYGANGYAGDAIRTEAVKRGHKVLAFSRSATPRANSTTGEVHAGNIHDIASVRDAVQQADVVVVALPAREIDGKTLKDAVPALLEAVASAGKRLGVVGGAGSLRVSEAGPMLLESEKFPPIALPEAKSHAEALAALRASKNGRWFYVSPAAAFGAHAPKEPVGAYLVGGDVMVRDSKGESSISAQDFAKAFVDEIETPKHENTRFSVVGAY